MNRPAPAYVNEITSGTDRWLRRCNGFPVKGISVSQSRLRMILGGSTSKNVKVDARGVISWTAEAGDFTAEPVREDAAHQRLPLAVDVPSPPAG